MIDIRESKTTLPCGVRVLLDEMPHAQSASIGFWVDTGSREEPEGLAGVCHFLEHMLFKGTARRTALEIARSLEVAGGSLNAFTDKEHTCFHAKVLASEVPEAIDVLTDMLRHSLLDPVELRREKAVVVEEIKMYEDTPDDLVHELAYERFWPDHPLGKPITGTRSSVRGLAREALVDFLGRHYAADRVVVAIAGRFERDAVLAQLAAAFTGHAERGPVRPHAPTTPHAGAVVRYRDVEQAHLVLTLPAVGALDDERYALAALNAVLGGGMSSRLFQEVREKRGLVYSISSYEALFREGGLFAVSAGMSPKHLPTVLDLVHEEFAKVAAGDVGEEELLAAKRQLKGSLLLELEVPRHRMSRMAQNELYFGRPLPPAEVLAAIDAVSGQDLARLATRFFGKERALTTVVGPLRKLPRGA